MKNIIRIFLLLFSLSTFAQVPQTGGGSGTTPNVRYGISSPTVLITDKKGDEYLRTTTGDNTVLATENYLYDGTQWNIRPIGLVQSEDGFIVLTAQTFSTNAFVNSNNGIYDIPSAGKWRLRYDISTDGSGAASPNTMFAIHDALDLVVDGTEKTRGGGITSSQVLTAEAIVTTSAATTFRLKGRNGGSGTTIILNATSNSTISWEKISDFVPVTAISSINALTGATASNTIDNTNFAQNWGWSTATTENPLTISAPALTTGTALTVTPASNSIGITNNGRLVNSVGTTTVTTPILATGSINDFLEVKIKNTSTGTQAQSGFTAEADNGTATTGFAWWGINNSTFNFPTLYNAGVINDVTLVGSGQDLIIANANQTKAIKFQTGKATTPFFDTRMTILNNGNVGINTLTPTGKLDILSTGTTTNGINVSSTTLTSGSLVSLISTSTAKITNAAGIKIALSGALATASQTTYGADIANTHTGTTETNVGLRVSASGATNNYGLIVNSGNVGIGLAAPTSTFHLTGSQAITPTTTAAAGYTALATDNTIFLTLAGAQTVTLSAAAAASGRIYKFVNPTSTEKVISAYTNIYGASSTIIPANNTLEIHSDGTIWRQTTSEITRSYVRCSGSGGVQNFGGVPGTTLTNWTELQDVNSDFSAGIFTAPRTGYYMVDASVWVSASTMAAGGRTGVIVSVNNSTFGANNPIHSFYSALVNPSSFAIKVEELKFLNAGDTVRLNGFLDVATVVTTDGNANFHFLTIAEMPRSN